MKRLSCIVRIGLALLLCLMPAVFAADGFGEKTTGVEGGTTAVVNNAVDFKELVETVDVPYVVRLSGAIDLGLVGGTVSIRSNKTIQGVDPNATITGQLGFKKGSSNTSTITITIVRAIFTAFARVFRPSALSRITISTASTILTTFTSMIPVR